MGKTYIGKVTKSNVRGSNSGMKIFQKTWTLDSLSLSFRQENC